MSTLPPPEGPQTPLSQAPTALTPTTTTSAASTFTFPPIYAFPPFFTLQPNPTTLSSQLHSWSTLLQSHCRHTRLTTLTLIDALPHPPFTNPTTRRSLSLADARTLISWMASPDGGHRAEWIATSSGGKAGRAGDAAPARCWVYWKRPEEWAAVLEEWVERTGQRGSVITLYEIGESEATRREEFHGIDGDLLAKSLQVCVKRGKAQVFGAEGSEGVKFF
ncbi:ESCRT-II complex, vps25 subunit [Karstenula rhodostoma CBS 690.94]|uniref:ESCRT-II complex subunit VPS25 n=1 Tax=Karstenula rhodostoma CBS 690.94 TaxID=1392251 RepID=A0A9P4UD42_9PLEO|nr:ESCRT-II complex, vps25 subunit [Karstenula rhodostoma CBS 690.94]